MNGRLIYHPNLRKKAYNGITVYHDRPSNNQDPYVWNKQFLHTYCHMQQMRKEKNNKHPEVDEGDYNFWVTPQGKGNLKTGFSALYCDLVFVVKSKEYWDACYTNNIPLYHGLVDSYEAYIDHYQWCRHKDKIFKPQALDRGALRFTLKADPILSFQPQSAAGELIDIGPFLDTVGLSLDIVRQGLKQGNRSRPFLLIPTIAQQLYDWLKCKADHIYKGEDLYPIRLQYAGELSSGILLPEAKGA